MDYSFQFSFKQPINQSLTILHCEEVRLNIGVGTSILTETNMKYEIDKTHTFYNIQWKEI